MLLETAQHHGVELRRHAGRTLRRRLGCGVHVVRADLDQARTIARKIRAGSVAINHGFDMNAPFGGYKRSGNGREWGQFAFDEYLETKAALGYAPE